MTKFFFFFSSRRRHTRFDCDWSLDVCSSDLGGEFIINGAERVVVSQLHRSPGVDFVMEQEGTSDRKLPSCRIIPERGSWIELNATKRETLSVRIDQSGKFSALTLLRAMSPKYSTDTDIIREFYETETEKIVDGR